MRTEIDNLGIKMLSQRARIDLADHATARHFMKLPEGFTREDLFVPSHWCNHDNKIAEGDTLRVRAHDGSFDFMITAVWVRPNGIVMKPWPIEPPAEAITAVSKGQ
jgi:hypothetical protein